MNNEEIKQLVYGGKLQLPSREVLIAQKNAAIKKIEDYDATIVELNNLSDEQLNTLNNRVLGWLSAVFPNTGLSTKIEAIRIRREEEKDE